MTLLLRIGAELRPATGQQSFSTYCPVSKQMLDQVAAAQVPDAQDAALVAQEAFKHWSRTGPNHRRQLVLKAAQLLEERAADFIQQMIRETGTTSTWARFNVQGSLAAMREAAALATQVKGENIPSDKPGGLALTQRVPVGVVLGIAPWNAPLLLGLRAILMPLICGNTVILKASEQCPRTHHMIAELLLDAGFPPGSINILTHDIADAAQVTEALIAHPAIRRINFTGSTRVGRIIGALAGQHLKPALLELGGKAPLVVLADADLDQAVAAAAFGAFMNQGQICMSTERIIVEEAIADEFVQRLAAKANQLQATNPKADNDGPLGALANPQAATEILALIDDAQNLGAQIVTPLRQQHSLFDPVVVDQVTDEMRLYHEESFGPIATVVRVADSEQAIRVANDTEYGLAAAVFGQNLARTLAVAQRIECGICHINAATVNSEAQLPFGGVKASGYGRFGGTAAIEEFTDLRVLTIQTQPQIYPF